MPAAKATDLREACLAEALKIIAENGVEKLSMREVSRRLGVSHQAPYKHFPSRDHILAEIVSRSFDDFAAYLSNRPIHEDASADLQDMGTRYMAYARGNPLRYRLMFNTQLPDPRKHPEMMHNARRAFALLRDRLATMTLKQPPSGDDPALDALIVWSSLHGMASILQSDTLDTLGLSDEDLARAVERNFQRISMALGSGMEEDLPTLEHGRPGQRASYPKSRK